MRTVGAIVFAVIGTLIVQFLFLLAWGGILVVAASAELIGTPLMMTGSVVTGLASYVGVYLALKIVSSADSKITASIVSGLLILLSIYSIMVPSDELETTSEIAFLVLAAIAGVLGCMLAKFHIDRHRTYKKAYIASLGKPDLPSNQTVTR